jgi:Tfp pilus assembly protein PilV
MRKANSNTRSQGQTLIEALVTMVFIAVTVIALIRFQNYLSYENSLSQQRGDATILAQSRIESLRDFQVLNNTGGYSSYQGIASGTSTTTGSNATYTVTWTVTSSTNPTHKVVDVTVGWTDRRGAAQSVRLISDVAGIEPANSAAVM